MSNRSETDLGAKVLDVLHEGATCELCAIVGDDPVRDSVRDTVNRYKPDIVNRLSYIVLGLLF